MMISHMYEPTKLGNREKVINQNYGICSNPEYNKPLRIYEVKFDALVEYKGQRDTLNEEKRYVLAFNGEDAQNFLIQSFNKPNYIGPVYALDRITVMQIAMITAVTPTMRKILHLAMKDDKRALALLEREEQAKKPQTKKKSVFKK